MTEEKLIRLVMPQWQGGNNPAYQFGAELLAWLAPASPTPVIRVPVAAADKELVNEHGIVGRSDVVKQLHAASRLIHENNPTKIAMLGGDCLVDLAPFSYLSSLYKKDFGILWIDAHPDVMTPAQFEHSHAQVLGALMGNGDSDLTALVKDPVPSDKVFIAGINEPLPYEADFLASHHIKTASPEAVRNKTTAITDWIKTESIRHLAIHIDLDVLNFRSFRSVLFANPDVPESAFDGIAKGKLEITDVLQIVSSVNAITDIVGIGIAEHLPWDAIHLKSMLEQLPLIGHH